MEEKQSDVPHETKRSQFCEICGPDSSPQQVWQCTACLQYFCVRHLQGTLHNCYSASKAAHE
jgi:hypothetical protein